MPPAVQFAWIRYFVLTPFIKKMPGASTGH